LKYTAKDIYQNVIITPFHNLTTRDLQVWVTSDLWTPASGTASITWYDWSGNLLDISTPTTFDVEIGAINSTKILQTNTNDILTSNNPRDVVLHVQTSIQGSLPNSNHTQTFYHENWLSPVPLSQARLVDPGLEFSYDQSTEKFSVEATTGVAAWVWLDYPAGVVAHFEDNGFWLVPGGKREIGFTVQGGSTNTSWLEGVTAESLWNLTLPN
jgi:beta-mannosidase